MNYELRNTLINLIQSYGKFDEAKIDEWNSMKRFMKWTFLDKVRNFLYGYCPTEMYVFITVEKLGKWYTLDFPSDSLRILEYCSQEEFDSYVSEIVQLFKLRGCV